jgi:hypothetical protein
MFRKTIQLLSVSAVSGLLIATQALAAPLIGGGFRPADDAGDSPLGLGANQLLEVHERESFTYGSRWAGFGTLDISVDLIGEEFEVEIVDTPPIGAGCSVYSTHLDGRVTQEISEDCDMEALLAHLQQTLPYADLYDQLGDWWNEAAADHVPGGGEDHSTPPGPYTEREDGAGECTAAQGHCMLYVGGAIATGIGTAIMATPFAGALVGSILVTGAILVCAGTIQDACNSFVQDILGDLFAGFPLDIGDPGSFLDGLDILQYVEALVDSFGQTTHSELVGLDEATQAEVDALLETLLDGFGAGLRT